MVISVSDGVGDVLNILDGCAVDAIEFCGERLHGTAKTHTFAGPCACRES